MTEYIRRKIKLLKHFNVPISEEILLHMQNLKSEIAIDNYATHLIFKNLGEDFTRGSATGRY